MIRVITTTSDTRAELDELAHNLVLQRLVACAQVEGPISSNYIWEEEVKTTEEFRLTLKTSVTHAEAVEAYIKENHSYELPEILVQEVAASNEYQRWVEVETSS